MKKILLASVFVSALASPAFADNIGVSMALFDDNWLTVLRNGMQSHASKLPGVNLQIEDAQNDIGKQLNQIQNFIASGVKAIIVNPVDTDATAVMSEIAAKAGIPLVFVNRMPVNLASLPKNQAFVGSDEKESGTLETKEVCRLLKAAGKTKANAVVLMGELSNQAARVRTQDIYDVITTVPECSFIKIAERQTANWSRTQAADLMTNWLSAGVAFDAVIANNDEMALGAIQAMKSAKRNVKEIVVGGIDGTQDALAAMAAGELDVTVFQNAIGQGQGALDAAVKLAAGQPVPQVIYVPFELVTPANFAGYQGRN